jgi:hypothetical protein
MATDDDGSILRRKMGLVFPRVSLCSGHSSGHTAQLVNVTFYVLFCYIINTVTDYAVMHFYSYTFTVVNHSSPPETNK